MRTPNIRAALLLMLFAPIAQASSCGWETEIQFEQGALALTTGQKADIVAAFERIEKTSKVLQVWTVAGADPSEGKSPKEVFELSVSRAHAVNDYVARIRPEFKGKLGVDPRGYQPKHAAGSPLNRRAQLVMTCPAYMEPPRTK